MCVSVIIYTFKIDANQHRHFQFHAGFLVSMLNGGGGGWAGAHMICSFSTNNSSHFGHLTDQSNTVILYL